MILRGNLVGVGRITIAMWEVDFTRFAGDCILSFHNGHVLRADMLTIPVIPEQRPDPEIASHAGIVW